MVLGGNYSCRTGWRFKAFYAKNGGTKWTREACVNSACRPPSDLWMTAQFSRTSSPVVPPISASRLAPGTKPVPTSLSDIPPSAEAVGRQCGEPRHQLPFAEVVGQAFFAILPGSPVRGRRSAALCRRRDEKG